jgi:hypothetical protein
VPHTTRVAARVPRVPRAARDRVRGGLRRLTHALPTLARDDRPSIRCLRRTRGGRTERPNSIGGHSWPRPQLRNRLWGRAGLAMREYDVNRADQFVGQSDGLLVWHGILGLVRSIGGLTQQIAYDGIAAAGLAPLAADW